jgi:hypothetical protein
MKDIDIFLDRLYKLTYELEELGKEFSDLYRQYEGTEFENQNYLAADKLDNSILAVTHEMASSIGFTSTEIKMLTDFIDFRKVFNELTDQELEDIIDNPAIPLTLKLNLTKRLTNGDQKLFLDKIQTIQKLWNKTFENKKYQQVRNKFSTTL